MKAYPKLSTFRSVEAFAARVRALGMDLPGLDADGPEAARGARPSALAQPLRVGDRVVGNRFAILPMEGWDGERDGRPSPLTQRRWIRFGQSGAKLIWGGEAVAVREDGRANPRQLVLTPQTAPAIGGLRKALLDAHRDAFGGSDDLLVGLQLTHSGRFARPGSRPLPKVAYRHPLLDPLLRARHGEEVELPVLSDGELDALVVDFANAAVLAEAIGFDFVDIKHCHGYLGHELLSAVDRPGRYGGSFENRTRFFRDVVAEIRARTGQLAIGVRLSVFDFLPFQKGPGGVGTPMKAKAPYRHAFGVGVDGLQPDLEPASAFIDVMRHVHVDLCCPTAGSPYYNPHIQRPALVAPSDGYLPPEDPLVGVARQIAAVAELKRRHPEVVMVGSAYSYLQEWLPRVAEGAVAGGMADSIGLGRMALSYPTLPRDVLAGVPLDRKRICRTFSDCTTAPRNRMVSGCYPLDPFYKAMPEAGRVLELRRRAQRR